MEGDGKGNKERGRKGEPANEKEGEMGRSEGRKEKGAKRK